MVVRAVDEAILLLDLGVRLERQREVGRDRVAVLEAMETRRLPANPPLRLTYFGGACGVLFILIKAYEWSAKIAQGHTMPSNEFFMFYYMLTGVHLFHVGLGLLILGIVVRELRNPRKQRMSMVESGATYWHMVDLLWIVIFGLLYVMR